MSRGIEEVEFVGFPILGFVKHRHRVGLNGDAFFPLQVHGIEELILSFPLGDGLGVLQEAVGQGRFPMIDVSDDGKITGEFDGHGIGEWSTGCGVIELTQRVLGGQ